MRYLLKKSLIVPLTILLLATVCLVSPVGDFPLIDDWLHMKVLAQFLESHDYAGHPYLASTLVAQVYWGALWALAFGLNYTVLRVSTLALALVAAWAVARCALEFGLSRNKALLCGALVLCNPIFLNLSYTFMSDVPFAAAVTLSGLCYLRALRRQSALDVLLGSLFAVLAFFVRQHGLVLSMAFATTVLATWRFRRGAVRADQIAAFLLPWVSAALLLFSGVFAAHANTAQAGWIASMTTGAFGEKLARAWRYGFIALAYIGLFCIPFFCAHLCNLRRLKPTRCLFAAGFWCLAMYVAAHGPGMTRLPYLPGILRDLGAGPLTLTDVTDLTQGWAPVQIGRWWWPVTWLALAAATLLMTTVVFGMLPALYRTARARRPIATPFNRSSQAAFLLAWAGLFVLSYMPFLPRTFDRYLLVAIIPCFILSGRYLRLKRSRAATALVLAGLAVTYVFSVASLQDFMAWHRAHWACVEHLLGELHVDPNRVDGGYEYNGVFTSDTYVALTKAANYTEWGDTGQWVIDDTYAISFLPRDGYDEIYRVPYFSWLEVGERNMLALKRR